MALLNLLSTALDVLFPASAADFNALSAAINNLFYESLEWALQD